MSALTTTHLYGLLFVFASFNYAVLGTAENNVSCETYEIDGTAVRYFILAKEKELGLVYQFQCFIGRKNMCLNSNSGLFLNEERLQKCLDCCQIDKPTTDAPKTFTKASSRPTTDAAKKRASRPTITKHKSGKTKGTHAKIVLQIALPIAGVIVLILAIIGIAFYGYTKKKWCKRPPFVAQETREGDESSQMLNRETQV